MRALVALTAVALRRLLREPLLVRALVAPLVLLTAVPFATALLLAQLEAPPEIAVADPGGRAALQAAGLVALDDPDPATAVAAGRAPRAAWLEGGRWVLAAEHGPLGRDALHTRQAEAALRDHHGAAWRLEAATEAQAAPPVDVSATLGLLLGAVYALFGAVVGLGVVSRDRASLEADLTLPVPAATHALALVAAGAVALVLPEAAVLALYEATLPGETGLGLPDQVPALLAPVEAVALALAWATARSGWVGGAAVSTGRGLTGALAGAAALLALGAQAPQLGQWLPLASLSALSQGAALPLGGQLARVALVVAGACALVQARVGR